MSLILPLLCFARLRPGATRGGREPSPRRPAGCAGAARCLVIPSPTGPSPSFPTLSSPPPHHDKPDLLSIKEPPATCSLSTQPPLLAPFLSSGPSSHLSFAPASVLLASEGLRRRCQGLARRGTFCRAWQGNGCQLSSRWQHSEKPPNGFGHIR